MQTTPLFYIDKILCYSSAYGINNASSNANWNLNLSQFTDIAIYLNSNLEVSKMYIDNISFTNNNTGTLSISYLPSKNFGKSPITEDIKNTKEHSNNIDVNSKSIELELASPITLRYLNKNIKENCIISKTDDPLYFDGRLL